MRKSVYKETIQAFRDATAELSKANGFSSAGKVYYKATAKKFWLNWKKDKTRGQIYSSRQATEDDEEAEIEVHKKFKAMIENWG